MKGWLLVNAFFELKKFNEIYELLLQSAEKCGITLEMKKTDEITHHVYNGFSDIELPDFIIFWDKDVYLAKSLENAGIRLFNSKDSIELCDNKAKTFIELFNKNVPVPKTILAPKTFEGVGYTNTVFLEKAIEKLGLPMVVKEVYGSFGQQVYLARTKEQALEIIENMGVKEFLMQEFVYSSLGKDIRINVVGDKVVASMLRKNENDFRSNVTNGGQTFLYSPTEKEKEIAILAVKTLKLDFAGVDVLFGKDGEPLICEVNSNPHFKSTLDLTGVNLADYIMEYIRKEMK